MTEHPQDPKRPNPEPESSLAHRLMDCIHCGLCLSSCPTFDELGTEADSPRGRIYFLRAVMEGRAEITPAIAGHLDLCLGCRACETACPSGVHYGSILEHAREMTESRVRRPWYRRAARKALLAMLTDRSLLSSIVLLGRLPGLLAGRRELYVPGFVARLVSHEARGPARLPLPGPKVAAPPEVTAACGRPRARVGLLSGCAMQVLFSHVNAATVRVLTRNGYEVVVPGNQGCCGALHLHQGARERALQLARGNVDAFEGAGVDFIAVNSAGCGSTMKEYGELLSSDPDYAKRASDLAARVCDVSELLASAGPVPPERTLDVAVAYHDACHLAHGQGIRSEPRRVLASIPGLRLVELPESDWCCGSAGVYNFMQPQMAKRLQKRKLDNIVATGAQVVAAGNPGCHLWILAAVREAGLSLRVAHPVELLDEAYEGGSCRSS
jgi:glycolate oxidase iron-sulfur subunit